MVYYNEFDAKKAAWLRELIARGLIAKGEVDERTIRDVQPGDLRGFAQCHFFAGIGIWSYALRLAGWPDDRPVWTASCPCQPFSAAGKRKGTADERHLWPELFRLIRECRPVVAIGEQVAGRDGLAWLDIVRTDLEECLYTCGRVVSPACGYGAPHRRERLYWVALANTGREHSAGWGDVRDLGSAASAGESPDGQRERDGNPADNRGSVDRVGYAELPERREGEREPSGHRHETGRDESSNRHGGSSETIGMGHAASSRSLPSTLAGVHRSEEDTGSWHGELERLGATRGAWAGADWVLARPQRLDGTPSLRPIEPGSFPLADGAASRVVRLRGYGDAIVAPQAAAFIRAIMEEL